MNLSAFSRSRIRPLALTVAVAVVLADSSVVILALPDILVEYDVSIARVAWVLTAFNLALALCAVPAAYAARRAPRAVLAGGLVVFAAASAVCALATSFDMLLVARCAQAIGGAGVVCAALEVLPTLMAGEAGAVHAWARAGAIGMALGPALGGALTQLLSWRAIFVAQVPVITVLVLVAGVRMPRTLGPAGRPRLAANLALGLISAALTAALFLLVLLLINGWGLPPLAAALTVTAMPVAAIAAGRLPFFRGSALARAAAGAVAVGLGLAALGLLPRTSIPWTIVPQLFVGVGLGLTVGALTEVALRGRAPQAIHGGWTVASRHLGVVAGIVILTPVFVADFDRQQIRAREAVLSITLDAPVDPVTKLTLMRRGVVAVDEAQGRIPDLGPVFAAAPPRADDRADVARLKGRLTDQLRRASTSAVMRSFLLSAAFALAALVPILIARRRVGL